VIRTDLTNEQYHAHHAISSSDVKAAARSLAHWKGAERKETPALDIGTAFHEMTLEPEMRGRIVRGPETRRGNAWKEAQEEAKATGQLLLTQGDYDLCNAMSESALRNPTIAKQVHHDDAKIEHSIFVTCPKTGLELRCRPDLYNPNTGVVVDLKSTVDASPNRGGFEKSLWAYNYDLQGAFYKYCLELEDIQVTYFVLAAVEKSAPYATCCHVLSGEVLDHAHERMMKILQRIKLANDEGVYPTDWPNINMIHLPEWMKLHKED
jgi:hypothetical protein